MNAPRVENAYAPHEFRLEKDELGQRVRLSIALNEADVAKATELFSTPAKPAVLRDSDGAMRQSGEGEAILLEGTVLEGTEQEFEALHTVLHKINDVSKRMLEMLDRIHGVTTDITGDLKAARMELAEKNRGH